jgi:hypothetical protein
LTEPGPSEQEAITLLSTAIESRQEVFAKILSRNDSSWADDRGKHQAGPYVPSDIRQQFFPALKQGSKGHIFETFIQTHWPQAQCYKESRLVHYSNKGPETHLTGVPKSVFQKLGPASLLVIWKESSAYVCLIFDSAEESYELALDLLGVSPEFVSGIIRPSKVGHLEELLSELIRAAETGQLGELVNRFKLPSTKDMANAAADRYIAENKLSSLNPFELPRPGDTIADIIEIEYKRFQHLELKLRVAQIAQLLLARRIHDGGTKAAIKALLGGFEELLAIFKSVRGSRSTRAGTSFELHLRRLLIDGQIPHSYQPVLDKRSPDFVLPTITFFEDQQRDRNAALVLTAKTTTRERWQQIFNEGRKRDVWFLASLDRTISQSVLDDLKKKDVFLVVPERHKSAGKQVITEYSDHPAVISFRTFFDEEIRPRRFKWSVKGINFTAPA